MNAIRFGLTVWMALLATMVVSCGGSGGATLAEGGIGGTGISRGSISAIGSVTVNGVKYETDNAVILADGTEYANQTDAGLTEGMVVTITGTVNADGTTGTADIVSYSNSLEGPITAIDAAAGSLTVFGRAILVDQRTRFELSGVNDPVLADFAINNVVEVSGFEDADGSVHATFIERKATDWSAGTHGELAGILRDISANPSVDASMLDLTGFRNADYVEVEGTLDGNGILVAMEIERAQRDLGEEDSDEVEMEGIVTRGLAGGQFVLDGQTVAVDGDTEYDGGLDTDIEPGVRLEVEGSLSGGVLSAAEVSFEESIELEGNIDAIDQANNALTLFEDPSIQLNVILGSTAEADLSRFSPGDHVDARAFVDNTGAIVATKLERTGDPGDPDVVLQGPVQAVNEPFLTVLGVSVDTSVAGFGFEGDGVVDSASFFSNVSIDAIVSVEGRIVGGLVTWDTVELDD